MVKAYIYEDTAYTADTDTLAFYIKNEANETIWTNVAYRRPGEASVHIYMNRIVADYMGITYPAETGLTSHPYAYEEFKLYNSGNTLLETYGFIFGFEDDWHGGDIPLTEPIDGHLDPRMRIMLTAYNTTDQNINITYD